MFNNKKFNFFVKVKKKVKFILYLTSLFIFITYFSLPKLFNYSLQSIKENLKINNNISINSITKVDYRIFPSPRLRISNSDFTIGKNNIEVNDSEVEIILNIRHILKFKDINYKKLLIKKGSVKIDLNNINQVLNIIINNNKKLIFKKNNLIFFIKDQTLFEINETLIKINRNKKESFLIVNGNFLNNKVLIKLNNSSKNKNNLTLKIPKLDIATRIFFERNDSGKVSGFFNLEVFNNFLKFNFIKKNNIKLTGGFIRSKLVNSSLEGEVAFKPNFYSKLDISPSKLNMKKLFPIIQKIYFSDNNSNLILIKKINGIFNFKSKLEGKITNKNGEILLEDFKVGKNKSYYFNARIIGFGKKGKIQFNLIKNFKNKKNISKKIEVIGFLIPSSSRIIFENFFLNGKKVSSEESAKYQNRIEDELIQNSLGNIFNESKMDKYFKNLF